MVANQITQQRGAQYPRTLQHDLAAPGDTTAALGSRSVTVQISGAGAAEVEVLRHPATATINGTGVSPAPESPHWASADPDDPFAGDLALGAVVRDYGASGWSWWMVRLVSGSDVTVFMSVDGDAA